jgi:predicted transcriptional regulator
MYSPIFLQAVKAGKLENRFLDKIDVLICLSEKEVAALGFLNADGRLDYHGFRAVDELSFRWTKALYSHYWNMATRREL